MLTRCLKLQPARVSQDTPPSTTERCSPCFRQQEVQFCRVLFLWSFHCPVVGRRRCRRREEWTAELRMRTMLFGAGAATRNDTLCTDTNSQRTPQLSGVLVSAIFHATVPVVQGGWTDYLSIKYEEELRDLLLAWTLEIMDHLWLWYDYSCLPQRKIRKGDQYLKNLFDRSLASLSFNHAQFRFT